MNDRERFLETLLYGRPDRIPLTPGGGRESTLKRWREEGLPPGRDPAEAAYRQAGGTLPWPTRGEGFSLSDRMNPEFEEKVLEDKKESLIVQDWKGNICEISKAYDVTYLRWAKDFVTRRWIRCPVESWSDWEAMKSRYRANDPTRLPPDAEARGQRLANRTWPLVFHVSGPFWIMREWMGFEGLCMAFYDQPDLIRDMVRFWTDFIRGLLERALRYVTPDLIHISEDMAYKSFSMISPAMVREFLLPCYRAWGEIVRAHGVPLYGVDSDGYTGELIPIWIEAGINLHDPIEVAAGNDLVAYHRRFGRAMAYQGGVDKRAIAKGGSAIRAELERLTPVIRGGGYIPGCDHGVPPDVSWSAFVDYVGLLARLTGWL
jgi:uroporphyrinogen decarboxylase